MLPDFLVIGAPKAGSTSLWLYLNSHPQVFMTTPKEPDFFLAGAAGNWDLGRDWYEQLFEGSEGALARGEASVRYASHPFRPGAPGRIAATIPDVRLIYLVREPVARMVSQWVHNTRIYTERRRMDVALRTPRYLLLSSYAYQLERFMEHLPREQLLVVISEQLRDERQQTLARIFRFLGVDAEHWSPELEERYNRTTEKLMPRVGIRVAMRVRGADRVRRSIPAPVARPVAPLTHRAAVSPAVSPALRAELHARLRDDVRRLRAYAGPSFDGWGIG